MDNRHFDEMNDDWSEYRKSSRKKQKHREDSDKSFKFDKRKDYDDDSYKRQRR